jgi:hypothetical protein
MDIWFQDNNIVVLGWPAQHPDINPIEYLWNHLKELLKKKNLHILQLQTHINVPDQDFTPGWINGSLYEETPECLRIVLISKHFLEAADMQPFDPLSCDTVKHPFFACS